VYNTLDGVGLHVIISSPSVMAGRICAGVAQLCLICLPLNKCLLITVTSIFCGIGFEYAGVAAAVDTFLKKTFIDENNKILTQLSQLKKDCNMLLL
jgi:hypothetical protein